MQNPPRRRNWPRLKTSPPKNPSAKKQRPRPDLRDHSFMILERFLAWRQLSPVFADSPQVIVGPTRIASTRLAATKRIRAAMACQPRVSAQKCLESSDHAGLESAKLGSLQRHP